jgi:NADPH-dependent 2,4-dienoyl-CoA reductase/sulfur reductase-like enzyme
MAQSGWAANSKSSHSAYCFGGVVQHCDIAIVGAGTAGIAAAIEAAQAGAHVVLIEQSERVGGTLHVSAAQMSGAGADPSFDVVAATIICDFLDQETAE